MIPTDIETKSNLAFADNFVSPICILPAVVGVTVVVVLSVVVVPSGVVTIVVVVGADVVVSGVVVVVVATLVVSIFSGVVVETVVVTSFVVVGITEAVAKIQIFRDSKRIVQCTITIARSAFITATLFWNVFISV